MTRKRDNYKPIKPENVRTGDTIAVDWTTNGVSYSAAFVVSHIAFKGMSRGIFSQTEKIIHYDHRGTFVIHELKPIASDGLWIVQARQVTDHPTLKGLEP